MNPLTIDSATLVTIALAAAGAMTSMAVVVGGSLIALARQVSALTADVASLARALAAERQERQAADNDELDRRTKDIERVHDRIDSITTRTRVQ